MKKKYLLIIALTIIISISCSTSSFAYKNIYENFYTVEIEQNDFHNLLKSYELKYYNEHGGSSYYSLVDESTGITMHIQGRLRLSISCPDHDVRDHDVRFASVKKTYAESNFIFRVKETSDDIPIELIIFFRNYIDNL